MKNDVLVNSIDWSPSVGKVDIMNTQRCVSNGTCTSFQAIKIPVLDVKKKQTTPTTRS